LPGFVNGADFGGLADYGASPQYLVLNIKGIDRPDVSLEELLNLTDHQGTEGDVDPLQLALD
jgi:hypothetical protein